MISEKIKLVHHLVFKNSTVEMDQMTLIRAFLRLQMEKIQNCHFFQFSGKTHVFGNVNLLIHYINSVFLLQNMGINEWKLLQIIGIAQLQQNIVGVIHSN